MKPITEIKNALLIIIAIFSAAFGLKGFLLSSRFIDGGVTGVSMLLSEILGAPLAALIFVINLPFVIIGYRQIGDYLTGKATLPEAIQRIKWDTHAFVRHQGNWFRRVKDAHRFDVTHHPATKDALTLVRTFLAK